MVYLRWRPVSLLLWILRRFLPGLVVISCLLWSLMLFSPLILLIGLFWIVLSVVWGYLTGFVLFEKAPCRLSRRRGTSFSDRFSEGQKHYQEKPVTHGLAILHRLEANAVCFENSNLLQQQKLWPSVRAWDLTHHKGYQKSLLLTEPCPLLF